MNNAAIHKALTAKLEETAMVLDLPVAWENTPFTPPATGIYLEEDFLPAETEDVFIQGSAPVRRGIYQVTVVYPIGRGTQAARMLAEDIADAFPNNSVIARPGPLFVNGFPDVFSGIVDSTAYRIPVSIPYLITA